MKRILRWFKVGAKVAATAAPDVLSVVYPPIGTLAQNLMALIIQAEADNGPGNGAKKKTQVLEGVRLILPWVLPMIERSTGRDIDDDLFIESADKLIDGMVGLMNSMGQLPKSK